MLTLWRFLPSRLWHPRAWKVWWSYVHWRLETYGVYYPDGRFHWPAFKSLLQQYPSYQEWLIDFDQHRSHAYKTR